MRPVRLVQRNVNPAGPSISVACPTVKRDVIPAATTRHIQVLKDISSGMKTCRIADGKNISKQPGGIFPVRLSLTGL